MSRRSRTRELIELGALVQKSGLAEIAAGDRALLFGALLHLAGELASTKGIGLRSSCRIREQHELAQEQPTSSLVFR